MRPRPATASIAGDAPDLAGATMTATAQDLARTAYALERSPEEYERLRAQARVWETATGHVLDRVELAPGASCLDAGCGPGETMHQMARRVGPGGRVTGIDVDAALGAQALGMLHAAGHPQCRFEAVDIERTERLAGAPFDLVFARLLLFHAHDPVAVLRRLWSWVAPGGHLVVQDYDVRTTGVLPPLDSIDELNRVVQGAFAGAGCDLHVGHRLPLLFARAGLGAPDGTDVAGRVEPLATASTMLAALYRSVLGLARALGLTTDDRSARWLEQLARDAAGADAHVFMWPLLIGAWKRKPS
jgi:SAM-dependent methyltransferase